MMKAKYIVRYSGAVEPNAEEAKRILSSCGAALIDDSMFPKMVLVELDEEMAVRLRAELKGDWIVSPEKKYKVPDTRRKAR
jgi:hypothetical protein